MRLSGLAIVILLVSDGISARPVKRGLPDTDHEEGESPRKNTRVIEKKCLYASRKSEPDQILDIIATSKISSECSGELHRCGGRWILFKIT